MSIYFMSDILALLGILGYLAAPFFPEEKKALQCRIGSELLLGLSFLYIGHIAGVIYFGLLALYVVIEKKIENNAYISLCFGIFGCICINLFNNSSIAGNILSLSFLLMFIHVNENKYMLFHAYLDCLGSLLLMYYCLALGAWVQLVFAVILGVFALVGLISSIKLKRSLTAETYRKKDKQFSDTKSKK